MSCVKDTDRGFAPGTITATSSDFEGNEVERVAIARSTNGPRSIRELCSMMVHKCCLGQCYSDFREQSVILSDPGLFRARSHLAPSPYRIVNPHPGNRRLRSRAACCSRRHNNTSRIASILQWSLCKNHRPDAVKLCPRSPVTCDHGRSAGLTR